MKKLIVSLMCLVVLIAAAIPAEACHRHHRSTRSSYARSNYARSNSRYAQSAGYNRYNNPRSAYYSYGQPRQRSFWQKHRDKLTVAGGTAGGAILGKVIGGNKGAAIGALSGAGGSALYTYKIRNKNRRY